MVALPGTGGQRFVCDIAGCDNLWTPDNIITEAVADVRAVETVDFMTARWARLPDEFLQEVSERIMNEVGGVSRMVYDISSKPPATIEWE